MTARIMTAVTAVSLLALTGCNGGIRNMVFGRGAACGACAATAPQYDVAPPAAYAAPAACAPPAAGCATGQCGSGYLGGGVNAYAPALVSPYADGIPGNPALDYPGSGYSYPAPVPESWVPSGASLVPGSAYMTDPMTPMAPPAL